MSCTNKIEKSKASKNLTPKTQFSVKFNFKTNEITDYRTVGHYNMFIVRGSKNTIIFITYFRGIKINFDILILKAIQKTPKNVQHFTHFTHFNS